MSNIIRFADQNITEIDKQKIPDEIPIIPLRNAVVFPGVILPIFVGRSESVRLIEELGQAGSLVALFTQVNAEEEEVQDANGLYNTGCLAEIHRVVPIGEGGYQVLIQGIQKLDLKEIISVKPYLKARVQARGELHDFDEDNVQEFREHVQRFIKAHPGIPDEIISFVKQLNNPASLANQIIFFSNRNIKEKIEFLEINSLREKIQRLQKELIQETQRLGMEKEVRQKVEEDAGNMQKEFYLRKQLETIRKELGDDEDDELAELEASITKLDLPEIMAKAVQKEIKRLRRYQDSPQGSGMEASQIRNWLEFVIELPWGNPELHNISLERSREILDADHEGLEDVKNRILEFLAVEKHTGGARAPILLLVGPPGVGKTSLARSVASALGRPFARAALGGVRDEAEIRGHRRTYVGALPGKILKAMTKADAVNPVMLLDEIDKLASSYQGDPASALLEVLDPEQNHTFEDHYLGEEYDLSRVLFICTANRLDSIPAPLIDRMEIVQLSGYTTGEKTRIATQHLWPNITEDLQLSAEAVRIEDEALQTLITEYTREAGVRNLRRQLESLARKSVHELVSSTEKAGGPVLPESADRLVIDTDRLRDYLGRAKYSRDRREGTQSAGVATGLAWTPAGGDILFIEATRYPGKGQLKLSGQLGDVMQESAHAALSYLKSKHANLGIDLNLLKESEVHIHVPGGAIPKDGPSAGVAMLSALTSLFTGIPLADHLAMTGEISLRGRVLPVGGIKEKVLAAQAAGIEQVFLPEKNRAEFEEIPEESRAAIKVKFFENMQTLLQHALPGLDADRATLILPGDDLQPGQREGW